MVVCFVSEFAETVGLSAASRMATINAKLVSIGRLYVNTEQYFPLGEEVTDFIFFFLLLENVTQ